MTKAQNRHKNNPIRFLTFALFAEQPCISRRVYLSHALIRVRTAPIRRLLRIPSGRFRDYLDWLTSRGYISEVEVGHGYAQFRVRQITDYNITDSHA